MKMHKLSLAAILALSSLMAGSFYAPGQDQKPASSQDQKAAPAQDQGDRARPPRAARGRPMGVEQRVEFLNSRLKLTDEQKTKFTALFEDVNKKRQAVMSDSTIEPPNKRQKLSAILEDETKKIKEILTAEQYTKYQEMRQRPPARPGAPGAPGQPAAPGAENKPAEKKSE
jgi:periplasmic protein CpxP/Spy